LNRPRRAGFEINLNRLDKFGKEGENIVVPGTVLGSGEVTKPLKVAAKKFSESAASKIAKAGGKCMTIQEMVEKNPDAKKVRIMG
jgi:large subunit ribosomal protein L18e